MKLDLKPTGLTFSGYSESKKATYALELEFYDEIVPDESKINHTGRDIEMVLRKKELKEEFWPRLLKDKERRHFLKTDFDKVRIMDLSDHSYVLTFRENPIQATDGISLS